MGAVLELEHLGLEQRRDNINIIVGDQTVLAQAMESGTIDVTVLDRVFSRRLKQKGSSVLVELSETTIPYVSNTIIGTRTFFSAAAGVDREHDAAEEIRRQRFSSQGLCRLRSRPIARQGRIRNVNVGMIENHSAFHYCTAARIGYVRQVALYLLLSAVAFPSDYCVNALVRKHYQFQLPGQKPPTRNTTKKRRISNRPMPHIEVDFPERTRRTRRNPIARTQRGMSRSLKR